MQGGCVCLTASVCLWHVLFDSILKHCVFVAFSCFIFLSGEKRKMGQKQVIWSASNYSTLTYFLYFFLFLLPFCSHFLLPFQSTLRHRLPFLLSCHLSRPPHSPGDWVNSTEWQADPAAVDGWADPLWWDQCPGGGGEGGYGERWPPLTGWPRGPGSWPLSCCPCWPLAWPGRPSPPPRRRRPLWNLKVNSRGREGTEKKGLGGSRAESRLCDLFSREQVSICEVSFHLKPDFRVELLHHFFRRILGLRIHDGPPEK